MNILLALCLLLSARCLWIRRATWPSHWDGSATNSIVLLTVNVVLMTPQVNLPLSPYLHRITGVWNLEQLFGHICYIGAMMGFLAMGALRLQMTDRQRQRFLRTHIQLAGCIYVPVSVALFVWAEGESRNIGDLVLQGPTISLAPYWVFMTATVAYLAVMNIIVLWALAEDPRSRLACWLYLIGFCCTLSNCALAMLNAVTDHGAMPMWISIRCEMIAFCVAAAVSYKRRLKTKGRNNDPTPAPARV